MSFCATWQWPRIAGLDPQAPALAQACGISLFLAQLLLNRGLTEVEEVRSFLDPNPPLLWPTYPQLEALVDCFAAVKASQGLVVIHGDYDADGLTGTALLTEYLREAGFKVEPFLPTRALGYGLNARSIERFIAMGCQLLITVDCGVSNHAEIELARHAGVKTVITDHHGLGAILPAADFILHPQVLGIPALEFLSGAGMAYWLVTQLQTAFPVNSPATVWLELAGLGTLADMTPLRGLNRHLVKQALRSLRQTQRPGLLALLQQKQLKPETIDEQELAFRVLPVLNAAGRLQSPMLSLELLLAQDPKEAAALAVALDQLNEERKALCRSLLQEIRTQLETQMPDGPIILAQADWPFGILGIVCAQLVELYGRPAVLIALEGEIGKASVRAPENFHVLSALQFCGDLLLKYGGHAQAGGFSLARTALPAFQQRFNDWYWQQGAPQHQPRAEMELNVRALTPALWQELLRLAPFGAGNPLPSFVSLNVPLQRVFSDRSGKHIFAEIHPGLRIKGWNLWQPAWAEATHFDLHYELEQETWRGHTRLALVLKQIQARKLDSVSVAPFQPASMLACTQEGEPFVDFQLFRGDTQAPLSWPESIPPHWQPPRWYEGRGRCLETARHDTWILRPAAEFIQLEDSLPLEVGETCQQLILQALPATPAQLKAMLQRIRPQVLVFQPCLSALTPPPNFKELQQLWRLLRAQGNSILDSHSELSWARTLKISRARIRLLLACLQELGWLEQTKAGEWRARIRLETRRYDLRASASFLRWQARYQRIQDMYALWSRRSLACFRAWAEQAWADGC